MICRYCQCDPNPAVLIPELCEQVDLDQSAFACVACALKREIYCPIHSHPHAVFQPDGRTACLICIEAETAELFKQIDDLLIELRPVNNGEITKLVAASAVIMLGLGLSPTLTICRWIATRMVVYKLTLEQVIAETIQRDQFDLIVPAEIYDDL